jgi:hypothetical protein
VSRADLVSGSPFLGRLSATGPSAQVAIAGAYAWAVTVAPVIGSRGASIAAKLAAGAALVALVVGVAARRWWKGRAGLASLAAFTGTSILAWMLAPAVLRPSAIDTLQGLAGMLGWGLFALASAGPALGDRLEPARVVDEAPLEGRRELAGGDALYLAGGTALALALQCSGWDLADPERALLARLVAIASGLAVIGASAEIALARHDARRPRSAKARWRSAAPAMALLGVLALSGLLLAARA